MNNLIEICPALKAWQQDLQKFDPSLEKFGDPWGPEMKASWDSTLATLIAYGLAFTDFNHAATMRRMEMGKYSLPQQAVNKLMERACRRSYQPAVTRLEDMLREAVNTHGEEEVVKVSDEIWFKLRGDTLVSEMQAVGFTFKDPEFLDRILKATKQSIIEKDEERARLRLVGTQQNLNFDQPSGM